MPPRLLRAAAAANRGAAPVALRASHVFALVVQHGVGNPRHPCGPDVAPQGEKLRVEGVVVEPVGHRLDDGRDLVRPRKKLGCPCGDAGGQAWRVVEVGECADGEARVGEIVAGGTRGVDKQCKRLSLKGR